MPSKRELLFKLYQGPAIAFLLVLVDLAVFLPSWLIEQYFSRSGLMIYTLFVLAGAVYLLEQCQFNRHSEFRRLTFGMTGGLLAWTVSRLSTTLGELNTLSMTGFVLFLMVALIVSSLWKRVLPVGVRSFFQIFLFAWFGTILVSGGFQLATFNPIFMISLWVTAVLACVGVVFLLFWIMFRSKYPQSRAWAALWIWFFVAIATNVFLGGVVL